MSMPIIFSSLLSILSPTVGTEKQLAIKDNPQLRVILAGQLAPGWPLSKKPEQIKKPAVLEDFPKKRRWNCD